MILDEIGGYYLNEDFIKIDEELKKLKTVSSMFGSYLSYNPLVLAVSLNKINVVKYLIEKKGISPNSRTYFEDYCYKFVDFEWALEKSIINIDIMKYLIEKGANINNRNSRNESVLFIAVDKNLSEIYNYLLTLENININSHNKQNSILTLALEKNNISLVKLLIGKKDININFNNGLFITNLLKNNDIEIIDLVINKFGISILNNEKYIHSLFISENWNKIYYYKKIIDKKLLFKVCKNFYSAEARKFMKEFDLLKLDAI